MVWILPNKYRIHEKRHLRSLINKTAFTKQTKSYSIWTYKGKKVKAIKKARPTLSNAEHSQHSKSKAWFLTLKPSIIIPFISNKPRKKCNPHANCSTNPRIIRRPYRISIKVRSCIGLELWIIRSSLEVIEVGEF